jgi:PHD/YefM family antitoxin component YafN of YafNO toxin-antitoxin module
MYRQYKDVELRPVAQDGRKEHMVSVPYIDPDVEHVGVSRLRTLNATNLRDFRKTLVIQDNNTPLAVLLTYEQFLAMQGQLQAVVQTLEVLTDEDELQSLFGSMDQLKAGRTKTLTDIRAALAEKRGKRVR